MTNKQYLKKDKCPYCTFKVKSAINADNDIPKPGDISFCMMCCNPSQFNSKMKMVKIDLNKIDNIIERNRLKSMQIKLEMFWDENPNLADQRLKYLKIMDKKHSENNK